MLGKARLIAVIAFCTMFIWAALRHKNDASGEPASPQTSAVIDLGDGNRVEIRSGGHCAAGGMILYGSYENQGSVWKLWQLVYLGQDATGTGRVYSRVADKVGGTYQEGRDLAFRSSKGYHVRIEEPNLQVVISFVVGEASDQGISVSALALRPYGGPPPLGP